MPVADNSIKRKSDRTLAGILLQSVIAIALTAGITALAFGDRLDDYLGAVAALDIRPRVPDVGRVFEAPVVVQLHLFAALTALVIGIVLLAGVKGNTMHRSLGWGWVLAMATTAVSSIFIRELNGGNFSFIHMLTGWTIIVLPMAVFMARRHNVRQHSRMMTGIFVGGLIIAGGFAFMPGRLLFDVFFTM